MFFLNSLFNVKVSQVQTLPLLIISGFCLGFTFVPACVVSHVVNTDGVKGIVHPKIIFYAFITHNFVDVAVGNIL